MKNFYITTPIYYLNGLPHIGHSYTSIAADILARFKRLNGENVLFLTGTDEHGMKVAQSAEKAGMEPQKFCDIISEKFRNLTNLLNLTNDDFIRTTEDRHIKGACALWNAIKNDLYISRYQGWYDVRDESFIQESEIKDGKAPSGGPVEWMEEESYFFKLSNYEKKLLDYYESHPDFIAPESRKNEMVQFVKGGLRDLCVSRTRFSWGIRVPGSEKHVMYVWIDALTNYISALGYPDMSKVNEFFPKCVHLIGKEILKFHTVYWPAFLMSADLPLPKRVFAHGWWTNEGEKMSKSVGNVIDPNDLVQKYGSDVVRFFLFKEVRFGDDGDFSEESFKKRISYDLANDLGNLVQRVLSFPLKLGKFTANYNLDEQGEKLRKSARKLHQDMDKLIDHQDISGALDLVWKLISDSNKYVDSSKPWEFLKHGKVEELNASITALCEAIRSIAICLSPYMPDTCAKIFKFMNIEGKSFDEISVNFSSQKFSKSEHLFPKE